MDSKLKYKNFNAVSIQINFRAKLESEDAGSCIMTYQALTIAKWSIKVRYQIFSENKKQ